MNRREFVRMLMGVAVAGIGGGDVRRARAEEGMIGRPPVAKPRIGVNLSGPADWNTELPFTDVFRLSRTWISQRKGASWGEGPPLELDERGWVKRLEPNCWAETLMCTIHGGHYPAGRYTVLYEGEGKIELGGAATLISERPGWICIEVDPSKGPIFLRITRTNPNNYVRDIHVVMPGFEGTFRTDPWHPAFLRRWRGMACLRFMDWMKTNGSTISRWSDRPTPRHATFTVKGVPPELMIDLCNRLKADGWFCMPHMADDDYIYNFARMVKEQLDPELKAYVEYSNEVWNSMFPQNRWAGEQGLKLGFAEKPWEATWCYTAYRSIRIFEIWKEVFGDTDQFVRVLPSQAASTYVSKRILQFRDAHRHADVLAIAPYITFNVPPHGEGITTAEVERWTVDQVFDHLKRISLPRAVSWMRSQRRLAQGYGLSLVAYEGGQHLVGVLGGENNEAVTRLFMKANADPRMRQISPLASQTPLAEVLLGLSSLWRI